MFRSMYGASSARALGSTWKRWTTHGYSEPMSRLDTMSSTAPMRGSRQRPRIAVMRNSTATTAAMTDRICRPGMVALTSVYEAPVMSDPASVTVAYWSSQMLTACSSR